MSRLQPPLDSFPLFDESNDKNERLPRTFRIGLNEVEQDGRISVPMKIKDTIVLGEALIDYSPAEDGYRFHDVLHVTFLALLGWSPVLRTLMHRGRHSVRAVFDVEDAGRATIVEETIVTLVHNHVGFAGLINGVTRIDPALLRTIRELTAILEVRCYGVEHWEHVILAGLGLWGEFLRRRRGLLVGNLVQRTLVFRPLPTG